MERFGTELIVDCLKNEGVKHLFGVSGSPTLPILDVVFHTPQIRYIQSQHEQAGIFMANGYARAARKAGICMVTRGPGATNCFTGVSQAFYTSTPSILLAAEEGTRYHYYGASLHHNLEGSVAYKPITKLSMRIERTDLVPYAFQSAFRTACTGRPGPVYLGIPRDVMSGKADVEITPPANYRVSGAMPGDPREISKAAKILKSARNPVILAGGGVAKADAQETLLELAELLAIPVGASQGNKGIIPDDHPLALGIVGMHGIPLTQKIFQGADAVLAVGCTFGEFTTAKFSYKVIPRDAKIIQVDIDPAEVGKIYALEVGIVGDARTVLEGLIQELKERGAKRQLVEEVPRIKELIRLKKEWEDSLLPWRTSNKVPIQRFRLLHDLRQALPRDAIVGAESGSNGGWFDFAFKGFVHTTSIGGWHPLGSEYCEALGVQVAVPDRVVVCVTGDGSIMMSLQELATAVANKIPVLCVVSHNDLYGNMHYSQIRRFGSRFIGTNLLIPNLANIAREFGAYGEKVERPDEIIPAVKRALNSGKPSLLDVMIDTSEESLSPHATLSLESMHHMLE